MSDSRRHALAALVIVATLAGCTGRTDTAAGPGSGDEATRVRLAAPEAVALGPNGSVYISEFDGNRVDRITPDGTLTVVAGTGSAGFSGDGGPATRARLDAPTGLVAREDGSLLVADHHNNRIRFIDTSGDINTLRGSVEAGLQDPIGIALGTDGALYVADELNAHVVRVAPSGDVVTVAGGGAVSPGDGRLATEVALQHPSYLVHSDADELFFTDFLDNRIRKVDRTGVITTIAGTGAPGFAGNGTPAAAATLSAPTGLALDPDGNLYFSDTNNNRVRRIDRKRVITTVAGTGVAGFGGDGGIATAATLNAPAGLAVDTAGNLYIADQGNDRVRRVDRDGVITTIAGGP